eukprot:2116731-Amphidinium_carterae.1
MSQKYSRQHYLELMKRKQNNGMQFVSDEEFNSMLQHVLWNLELTSVKEYNADFGCRNIREQGWDNNWTGIEDYEYKSLRNRHEFDLDGDKHRI